MIRNSWDQRFSFEKTLFSIDAARIEGCKPMNISSCRYAAILFSEDDIFIGELESSLKNRFEISTYSFHEHNPRETLQIAHPMVILWDGRQPSPQSHQFLGWLRSHFPGCPILALMAGEKNYKNTELHKRGINLLLDTEAPNFYENLEAYLSAIIRDCRTVPSN